MSTLGSLYILISFVSNVISEKLELPTFILQKDIFSVFCSKYTNYYNNLCQTDYLVAVFVFGGVEGA